jgi:glycosyltransferase involved in cell wall biosynthesis
MGEKMKSAIPIDAVIVAVPAHNEERRITAAIRSILAAIDPLDPRVAVSVSIAADGCTDRSIELLETIADHAPVLRVIRGSWHSAGGARRAAVASGLASLGGQRSPTPQTTWIATTDADSCVPRDWLTTHLRFAEAGYDAIAGTVELNDDDDRTDDLVKRFARNYLVGDGTHTHVHGANMGIRASSYLAAGGFPPVVRSEDRLLWNELLRLNFAVISPVVMKVATSGRLRGRVVGGFADAMATTWT